MDLLEGGATSGLMNMLWDPTPPHGVTEVEHSYSLIRKIHQCSYFLQSFYGVECNTIETNQTIFWNYLSNYRGIILSVDYGVLDNKFMVTPSLTDNVIKLGLPEQPDICIIKIDG